MIWDSQHWKTPLLESAERLDRFKSATNLSESHLVQIEKDIFLGFYSIRKLFETITKVTDATKNSMVEITWCPNIKTVTRWNWHKLDELYNFESTSKETRSIWFISSRIIHSFIFAPLVSNSGGLEGICFTSDHDKDEKLYLISVDQVSRVFRLVGNDEPCKLEWKKDPNTGKEIIKVE